MQSKKSNGLTFLIFRNYFIDKKISNLISSLLFAPFAETLIFVYLLHRICHRFRINDYVYIFISAATFASAFVAGLIFAYSYIKYRKSYNEGIAFSAVCIIHSLTNAMSLFV